MNALDSSDFGAATLVVAGVHCASSYRCIQAGEATIPTATKEDADEGGWIRRLCRELTYKKQAPGKSFDGPPGLASLCQYQRPALNWRSCLPFCGCPGVLADVFTRS